jgi:hypothetical protein
MHVRVRVISTMIKVQSHSEYIISYKTHFEFQAFLGFTRDTHPYEIYMKLAWFTLWFVR